MNLLIQIIIGVIISDFLSGLLTFTEEEYFDYLYNSFFIEIQEGENNEAYSSVINYVVFPTILFIEGTCYYVFPCYFINNFYFFVSFFIFSCFIPRFHIYLHASKNPYLITFLQQHFILCSIDRHKKHHEDKTKNYCLITPITNIILDNIHFWRLIEKIIFLCFRIKPNRLSS